MDELWDYVQMLADVPPTKRTKALKFTEGPDDLTEFLAVNVIELSAIVKLKLPYNDLNRLGILVPEWLSRSIGMYRVSEYRDTMTVEEWLSKTHCDNGRFRKAE